MFSRKTLFSLFIIALAVACSSPKKLGTIRSGDAQASLSLPSDKDVAQENEEVIRRVTVDTASSGPLIMNAIRDEQTGEMVATDVIVASKVTARFRNVAERFGKIYLEFDVHVPAAMIDSRWQLRFRPEMIVKEDTVALDPILITGRRYRDAQLRGYQRYDAFLRSIITDTTEFIYLGQLEVFLQRHYPDTYAMKNDTTIISEPDAENYFGVTQRQALEHYRRHILLRRNERRKGNVDRMFHKYVKDPLVSEGIRLDTVMTAESGEFIYRYTQQVNARPGVRKITVRLEGSVYDQGRCVCEMPAPEDLVFYISSLSSLTDNTERYLQKVLERKVYDRTLAFIDFHLGRWDIDTTLGDNAAELRRILQCVESITLKEEFVPDSIVVSASCSPEGAWSTNAALAQKRSRSLTEYLDSSCGDNAGFDRIVARPIPENWTRLETLVQNDSGLSEQSRGELLALIRSAGDRDVVERKMSRMPQYKYLREKIYPSLRTVQLEFHLHRRGMVKDTIHTTELDTAYMRGVEALKNLDYKTAVEVLRPYGDYNSALALASMSYNYSALEILDSLGDDSYRVMYLKALVLARLERREEAMQCYRRSVELEPSMAHRANLDPELTELIKEYR